MIDVLVSNAGICPFAEFLTMPHAVWERTRQVNLDGSFYVTQGTIQTESTIYRTMRLNRYSLAVANQLKQQTPQGGSIIGISSISALVGGELQWSGLHCLLCDFRVAYTSTLAITRRQRQGFCLLCKAALWRWDNTIFARTPFSPAPSLQT